MHSGASGTAFDSPKTGALHAGSDNVKPAHRLIDVHHHFEPTAKNVDGTPWSIQKAIDEIDRNGVSNGITPPPWQKMNGVYAEFGKLYFECAQAYAPETFAMLLKIVPSSHVLYGSDYSYFPISHSVEQLLKLGLPDELHAMVSAENAAVLLPRWSAVA